MSVSIPITSVCLSIKPLFIKILILAIKLLWFVQTHALHKYNFNLNNHQGHAYYQAIMPISTSFSYGLLPFNYLMIGHFYLS